MEPQNRSSRPFREATFGGFPELAQHCKNPPVWWENEHRTIGDFCNAEVEATEHPCSKASRRVRTECSTPHADREVAEPGLAARPPLRRPIRGDGDQYIALVDWTSRSGRDGKPGSLPTDLTPILERLEIDSNQWYRETTDLKRRIGTAVGRAADLAAEAARRGTQRVISAFQVSIGAEPATV